jgi:hypothetical protein
MEGRKKITYSRRKQDRWLFKEEWNVEEGRKRWINGKEKEE